MRDQRILSYALGRVWATDEATRQVIVGILARHSSGLRLSDQDLAEIRQAGRGRPPHGGADGLAVVPLWGPLVPHAGMMVDVSTEGTGLDEWRQMFLSAVNDPAVSTVLIRVYSPGGSAEGVTETAKVIRDARSSKRIVAVADGYAASAAFALASQAETFLVTPSGMVGAVHTYTIHEDVSAMLERDGVKVTLIGEPNDGEAEITDFVPLSEENLAHMQQVVRQFYDRFVQDVAAGRGLSASTVEANFGGGRVLTARDALSAGMVDGVMPFEEVLARLVSGKALPGAQRQQALPAAAAGFGAAVASASSNFLAPSCDLDFRLTGGSLDTDGGTLRFEITDLNQLPVAVEAGTEPGVPTAPPAHNERSTNMNAVSTDGRPPTLEELAAEKTHLKAEMDEMNANAAGRAFTPDEQTRFDNLEAKAVGIDETIKNINDRAARIAKLADDPQNHVRGDSARGGIYTDVGRQGPQDIFDLTAYRSHARSVDDLASLWRDGALRANESVGYRTGNKAKVREFVEQLLRQDEATRTFESFSHRFLMTANPAYEAAFGRWVMGRASTADENMIRMAVTNTGLGGETPVPVTIDPTVLYTGDGARSPLRSLAQVVTITGLTWRGIGSDGVTLSYGAEDAEITPQTPDFDAPDVSVIPARGEIQFSVDVDGDWPTLRSELQRMFNQAKFRLEADKFLNGTGTNEPTGLIWALDDDGSSVIDTATANVIAWADITGLTDALPSAFDFNAQWLAHKSFYTLANGLAVAEGYLNAWQPLTTGFNQQSGDTGHTLLNSRAYTASEISTGFTTGNEEVAVIGDFNQGFVIIDRVGLNVELDMHPRNTNGKWTGNRALVCWFRNNTALRTPNAFRLLRVKHT